MPLIKIDPTLSAKTVEQVEALRKEAYAAEADPLFFKWQRGAATKEEWVSKIAEIKMRFQK